MIPWCVENNTSFIPWGGLAYGLLGGRYTRDFSLDENDWRHRTGMFAGEAFEKNMDVVDELKRLAAENGTTAVTLAVQWIMAQPAVDSVIAGAKNSGQVSDNFAIGKEDISGELLAAVGQLTEV